ncbi:DMT family transporter [Actinoalloteichus hymeniacidonis]|uniref:Permease, DMT superfamily n=1 Tax=Actinoalloteichus hymeniacidonis TaxID=340345 RepID=A0AAC9HT95_9PSEU|nr:DMT family transporter [Actinoalloteichus hymeniacidonis]AOS65277.1 putative permease, DMT superfamily [Actinoalloteichus hymeniacidonis]MBB5906639.1 drug/metabolite transporter (DMT)-like permease [Actinoalloteichus hymeniacidonis]
MTGRTRGTVLLAVLALAWGSNFLWIKIALEGFDPITLTFGRLVLGALVLFAIVGVRRERLPRDAATWGHLAVAALLANAAPYLLFAVGETRVDSGIAGALNATTPLWTLLLASALRTQNRPTTAQAAGFLLGFLGCLLVFQPWTTNGIDLVGALICLAAAFSYALSYLYIGRHLAPRELSPVALSAGQLLAAAALLALALPFGDPETTTFTAPAITALLVLGVLGTGLAYIVNYALIRTDGAPQASLVSYLLPAIAVVLGALFLGEPLTATLIGVVVILFGVAVSRRQARPSG